MNEQAPDKFIESSNILIFSLMEAYASHKIQEYISKPISLFDEKELDTISLDIKHILDAVNLSEEDKNIRMNILNKIR